MLQAIFPAKEKHYQVETQSIIHTLQKKKKKLLKMVNICGRYNTPFFSFFLIYLKYIDCLKQKIMTMCFWVYNICGRKRYTNNITEDGDRANGSIL